MDNIRANEVMDLFKYDPAEAAAVNEQAYCEFCRAWETLYPTEYIQRQRMAGRTTYAVINID